MHPPDSLRVCTSCDPPHYENCDTCFGFGVFGNEGVPVSASKAIDWPMPDDARACPRCRSTTKGVPT